MAAGIAHDVVLSASRRTDIPAFYMPWFMEGIARGEFHVVNPVSRQVRRVPATCPPVHVVVFWSKNFGPFITGGCSRRLTQMGYRLFFQFTVNSENRTLEPNVPPLEERLGQLRSLCAAHGPQAVNWRFDPICLFRDGRGPVRDNLQDLPHIAEAAAACGIRRCTVSFMDPYAKVSRRAARRPGFAFAEPTRAQQVETLLRIEGLLAARGIRLSTCCESEALGELPAHSAITSGACIPSGLLMALYGGNLSLARDRGQRVQAGCGCRVSVDIGSYDQHPCGHGCLYCYAG
jgi:hypothetical protein